MKATVTKGKVRLVKNSIFSLIAWFFPIILGFIATPILVRGLGTEQYGLYAVILGFIGYSFTFGIGKVVAKYIPEFEATGRSERISDVVSTTLVVSVVIGLSGFSILAAFTPTIVTNLLLIAPENREVAANALYLACAIGFVTILSQVFQFVIQGMHKFGAYVILTNLSGLMIGIGNIVLVLSGFGLISLLVWNLFTIFLLGVLFFIQARRFVPNLRLRLRFDREIVTLVTRYAGSIILFQIFGNILLIFERSWVVRKFGAEAMTYYFVPMLLAIYMHGMMSSFVQAIFPVVNELLNDRDKLADLYRKTTKIVVAIVVLMVATFICSGKVFLTLWVNSELADHSYPLLMIHGITFGLIAIGIISLQIAESFRFAALTAIVTGTWMVIAIPFMILVADRYQSEGIAIARLTGVVITFPLIFFVEQRFLGKVFVGLWLGIVWRTAIAVIIAAAVQLIVLQNVTPSRITFVLCVGFSTMIYAVAMFLIGYFDPSERDLLLGFILRRRSIEPVGTKG